MALKCRNTCRQFWKTPVQRVVLQTSLESILFLAAHSQPDLCFCNPWVLKVATPSSNLLRFHRHFIVSCQAEWCGENRREYYCNIPSTALSSRGFAFWECLQKRWRWNCESSRNLRQPRENWTSSTKAQSLHGLSHTATLISWEKKANKAKLRSSCQLVWICMDPGMKIVHMAIDHTWYRQPSCIFTCQNFLFLFPKYTKAPHKCSPVFTQSLCCYSNSDTPISQR